MLGDGTCQSECLTDACNFDQGDCDATLCSTGCYSLMIDDGICDEICYVESCEWDGTDCDCSPGCKGALLANEECDPQCNTADCGWDGMHCGCAADCSFSDLGQCKPQCLVDSCNYDALPDFPVCANATLRRASKAYYFAVLLSDSPENPLLDFEEKCKQARECSFLNIAELASIQCLFDECRNDNCNNMFWSCNALPNCAGTLWTQHGYECVECIAPMKNSFGKCEEECVYGAKPLPEDPSRCILEEDTTTEANPLKVFVSANYTAPDADGSEARPFPLISQALKHAIKHYSMVILMDPEHSLTPVVQSALLTGSAHPPVTVFDNQWVVWILPYRCLFAASCERAQLTRSGIQTRLIIPGYNRKANICSETVRAGELRISHINFMDAPSIGYSDFLINVHYGSLVLRNVSFINITKIPRLIVLSFNNTILMENVDFVNVSCVGGCIMQFENLCEEAPLSALEYHGGTVSVIGTNQPEYFITLRYMQSVTIESVNFTSSTSNSVSSAFITLESCCVFVLSKCVFANNTMGARNAVAIVASTWSLDDPDQTAHFAKYVEITNIVIEHVGFYNNSYTQGSALYFSFPRIFQSIVIENCTFENEFTLSSLLVAAGTDPVSQVDIRGPGYYSEQFHRVDCTPAYFRLANLNINRCFTGNSSALVFANLSHIDISHARATVEISECAPLIWVSTSYGVTLQDIALNNVSCASGNPGLHLTQLTGNTVLSLISFTGVRADAFLLAQHISSFQLLDSVVVDCSSELGLGGVQLEGNFTTATLRNVTFENNRASSGGALSISMVLQVAILNSTFRNNSATFGGAIMVSLQSSRVEIIGCRFLENSASLSGGAINVQYTPPSSSLSLLVSASDFAENQAYQGGGVSIATGIDMQPGSVIENSKFSHHYAEREGVLSLSFFFGSLQVLNSSFTDNEGLEESVLFVNHNSFRAQSLVSITLNLVRFERNTGSSIIHALDSNWRVNMDVANVEFVRNSGIALLVTGALVTASNVTFRENTGAVGPALTLEASAQGRFAGSTFEGNSASLSAGAVLNTDSSFFSCSSCNFIRNIAGGNGGAIVTTQKAILVLNATLFSSNRASESGSALYFLMSNENNTIQNSTFRLNSAGNSGVVYMFYSTLAVDQSSISANSAENSPGFVLSLSTLSITRTEFASQVGSSGWFLHIQGLSSFHVDSSTFRDCSGAETGAFYLEEGSVVVENSQFLHLSARFGSVAYVLSRASLSLANCSISDQANIEMGIATILQTRAEIKDCRFFNYSGSAVWGQNAILKVSQSNFKSDSYAGGKGSYGVGINCDQCASVVVETSAFNTLEGERGSGVSLSSSGGTHEITHCSFFLLTAQQGAAVQAQNVHLTVNNNQFLHNSALSTNGGALALSCDVLDCVYRVERNIFTENRATLNGGALAWTEVQPELTGNIFDSNFALYGNDYSSFPTHIATGNSTTLPPTPSGQVTPYFLTVTLRDHYSQVVSTENAVKAVLIPADTLAVRVSGVTEVTAVRGEFKFDSFVIEAKPGSLAQIKVRVLDLNSEILFTVPMRDCVIGESLEKNKCVLCEAGKYSFDPSKACKDCMSGAVCEGNFTVIPRPGYWRADYLQTTIFTCPNREACIGQTLTGMCADGYEGNKCQTCAKHYFRTSKVFCSPCSSKTASYLKVTFIFLGISTFAVVVVITSIRSAHKTQAKASVYLKILMNYLQLVMLMGAFNLSWPSYVKNLLEIQDSAGGFSEQIASAQCMHDDYDESSEFYDKTIAVALIPIAVTTASSILWIAISMLSQKYEKLHRELVGSAVILFFLVHPSVMRAMFAVFSCEEIRAGEYWVTGLRLRCWKDEHWKYAFAVALPSIIVWGVGIPALILILLIVKRKTLSELNYKIRFGYLYSGYKPTRYYWEFVAIYRKLVIISLSVFLSRMAVLAQSLLALLVLLISLHLHSVSHPFTSATQNVAEHRSLLVSTVTLFAGLFYLNGSMGKVLDISFFVCVIGVNVYFLQYWVRQSAGAWLVFVVKRVKFLQRFFVEVGEEKIVLRSRRVLTTEGKSTLMTTNRKIPALLRQLYFQQLENQQLESA